MLSQEKSKLTAPLDAQDILLVENRALLKQLVKQVGAATPVKICQRTNETIDEVIFESDVDGIKYYLVRCRLMLNDKISLSSRELEVARLVAQGFPNKNIGKILKISPWTVATHLRRIFTKLSVTSRVAMVSRLMEESLL